MSITLWILLVGSFKAHINKHHPKDVLDLDEFLRVRQEVVVKTHNYTGDDEDVGLDVALGIDGPPGTDAPPGMDTSVSARQIAAVGFQIKNLSSQMFLRPDTSPTPTPHLTKF